MGKDVCDTLLIRCLPDLLSIRRASQARVLFSFSFGAVAADESRRQRPRPI